MSIILKGFINNTIIVKGYTKQSLTDKVLAIFLQSRVSIALNIASRIFI